MPFTLIFVSLVADGESRHGIAEVPVLCNKILVDYFLARLAFKGLVEKAFHHNFVDGILNNVSLQEHFVSQE